MRGKWKCPVWIGVPAVLFAVLYLHGAWLGLTDDEAYYWVLAQRPSLGYAFHPPAVAWSIAAVQSLFGWLLGPASPALVRLPSALYSAGILALALRWLAYAGVSEKNLLRSSWVLLGFAGIFGASWMMVPDLPLFFGWMLAFVSGWRLCFVDRERAPVSVYLALGVGLTLAMLSKYSAVLGVGSAVIAFWLWAPKGVRGRAIGVAFAASVIAAIPVLVWNANHEWGSILYQIRERHGGGGLSWKRYGRFWGSQLLLAGPVLLLLGALLPLRVRALKSDVSRYVAVWAFPAALIFCLQPLWADFKPHWALVVWWPIALEFAWLTGVDEEGSYRRWGRVHVSYGAVVMGVGLLMCHVPVGALVSDRISGKAPNPLFDVTNDMYGWAELKSMAGGENAALPIVGSRYQTASQAAFAVGDSDRVTFIPRDIKQRDEWPDLGVSEHQGPAWPRLLKPVLFVTDNRYTAGPEFPGARCEKISSIEKQRWGYFAKRIDLWRCDPR